MWSLFKKWAARGFGCTAGILGALLLVVGIICAVPNSHKHILGNAWGIINPANGDLRVPLNQSERTAVARLYDKGALLSTNDVLTAIMSYYSTIITLLICIIGVMGVVAFMYIRGVSKDTAINEARDHFSSKIFNDLLKDAIDDNVLQNFGDRLDEIDGVKNLPARMDQLDEQIEELQGKFLDPRTSEQLVLESEKSDMKGPEQ